VITWAVLLALIGLPILIFTGYSIMERFKPKLTDDEEYWRWCAQDDEELTARGLLKDQGCARPPQGWWCSREPNHDGPCAARLK
jgi:hypothetical protein